MLFSCLKGGDNIYSIFGEEYSTEDDFYEEVENVFIDWILSSFERYQKCPPKNTNSLDDIARYLTKEFNVKKFIYETKSNESIEKLEKILEMDIDEIQKQIILEQIGEQTPENENWVSETRIFEILTDYQDITPNSNAIVCLLYTSRCV